MKSILTWIFCVCALLSSCNFIDISKKNQASYVHDEDYERIASRLERKFIQKMKTEKELQCIGIGGKMMNDIQEMGISFQYFHVVDLSEARLLLVHTATEYLNEINNSRELRPYLHNYPFTYKNIAIRIFIRKPDNTDVSLDEISYMSCIDGLLTYDLPYKKGSRVDRTLHKETYEEALKTIEEEEETNRSKAS